MRRKSEPAALSHPTCLSLIQMALLMPSDRNDNVEIVATVVLDESAVRTFVRLPRILVISYLSIAGQ